MSSVLHFKHLETEGPRDPSHWFFDVSVQSNDKTTISAKKGGGAGGLRPQKSLFVLEK